MAFIVTDACIKCKYTDCVDVCPVACFHEGEEMLVINPEECIDCGVCVDECPVTAIYSEDEVPEDQKEFIALNARLCENWPLIEEGKDPLASADDFKEKTGKLSELNEAAGSGS